MMTNDFNPTTRTIRKRDGTTVQAFDVGKIERAIAGAWKECFGAIDEAGVERVVRMVLATLPEGTVDIETIQNAVEVALMRCGHFDVAKAFILYRQKRAEARALRDRKPDPKALSNYIHVSKYARFRPDLGRREVFAETVQRVEDMHVGRFPELEGEIREAFDLVREQRVLPSMRSFQFAGPPILRNSCKLYNCCFSLIDRLEAFSEAMFLLLCGCGVGYSVQFDHVEKLPPIRYVDKKQIRHHVVGDTIEGWADALKALVQSYQDGVYLELSYHLVRPAGSPLKMSGGKAPGHVQLKKSLERIRDVLDGAQGRQLRPIEAHRVLCHAADTALSGGIRRSAMICLFSLDDSEMMNCKTGNWFEHEPWFANANNSVAMRRDEVKKKQFLRIFSMTKSWGDPGIYFVSDYSYGVNPCGEVGLNPRLVISEKIKAKLARRDVQVRVGDVYTGWTFCNLVDINAAKFTSLDDFMTAARAATFIGTIQATYTNMPYLGWVSETLAEREALLGIGMTGMLDAPAVACNPEYQRKVAGMIKHWNREYAAQLDIEPAARTTLVKPSGTTSLELGGVASGHHAHHARRYIRRVTADEHEYVFQEFRKVNPGMCVRKPDGKFVIEFPVEAPAGAVLKEDLGAIQFLEMVRSTQENWVLPGTGHERYSPGLTHNVSNTIHVKDDEWDAVAEYLWDHRDHFTGVALLPATADKAFSFAPNEAIVTEADEVRWNNLLTHYTPVDYSALVESSDETTLTSEPACAGGACAVT
jgi:ribonucleoside-triphosphate reductase (thioredoxin)